ncbi:MAG TPA: RND family transporter [Mycobacterium sp.]|nr:RND family transporter [Mycobacterium sp.]
MSRPGVASGQAEPSFVARTIRRSAVLIVLAWLAVTALATFAVPSLEQVAMDRAVSLSPKDAPSMQAMKRMGQDFKEYQSDSFAMIVLEGDHPLGDDAHKYYDSLVRQLKDDPEHVENIQDFWGDPLVGGSSQSDDGRAVYVQLNLVGDQGTALGNASVEAVRKIVDQTPAPQGVKAYVTGAAPLVADMHASGNKTIVRVTALSVAVIFTMLLLIYRSVITVVLLLLMVGIELSAARGIVALLGHLDVIGLSPFAVSLLVSLAIAAGTDYGIFFIGRYQEARQAGEDRETAYYTTYRGVAPVVLASGLTIAGAVLCLRFARMPYFQSLGIPCAVGLVIAVAVAVTLAPAVLCIGSRFGLFEPRREISARTWRRVGTVIARWPAPVLTVAFAAALVGLLALPGYKTSYDDRLYIPKQIPANLGYAAAERHFPSASMMPDILLLEANHDMRNPTDFLILDKLAKAIFRVHGIARVQAPTRPDGTPMAHSSIPFQMSLQNAASMQSLKFQKSRMNDMLAQADALAKTIASMKRMYQASQQLSDTTHRTVIDAHEMQGIVYAMRDGIADFEDFWRPLRNYFYWEPHCFDIPMCWSFRSIWDTMDGVDQVTESMDKLFGHLENIDKLMPQMLGEFPSMIDTMATMRTMMLTMHSTMSGLVAQMEQMSGNAMAMGKAFDAAKNDDSFYLPPEVFENPQFKRLLRLFFAPDGKAVRMTIVHHGDPATPEGIARVTEMKTEAAESIKGTPMENARIYLTGTAATFKDFQDGSKYDLWIAGISALCLIFAIMVIITRSLVAALVIVGTVALSLGASFGLSVLVWQYLVGMYLHWLVLAMSVIVLLAVGSDYNLLLVSRFKEEIGAGIHTGIIRAMGGTGKVVTSAGLVFAFTMAAMVVSDLHIIGQVGTTIGLGLLFDTLIVRSFMTPSIAVLLGRWFWWPQTVRPRPASFMLRSAGPRPLVRALLLGEGADAGGAAASEPSGS